MSPFCNRYNSSILGAITLLTLVPNGQIFTWDRSEPGYSKNKQEFGDQLITIAEKAVPKLKDHIIYREDASPATFARYAWTTGGAIYGLAIDEWRPSISTPINGLYLTGAASSQRPGVEDAVYSGMKVADLIMQEIKSAS